MLLQNLLTLFFATLALAAAEDSPEFKEAVRRFESFQETFDAQHAKKYPEDMHYHKILMQKQIDSEALFRSAEKQMFREINSVNYFHKRLHDQEDQIAELDKDRKGLKKSGDTDQLNKKINELNKAKEVHAQYLKEAQSMDNMFSEYEARATLANNEWRAAFRNGNIPSRSRERVFNQDLKDGRKSFDEEMAKAKLEDEPEIKKRYAEFKLQKNQAILDDDRLDIQRLQREMKEQQGHIQKLSQQVEKYEENSVGRQTRSMELMTAQKKYKYMNLELQHLTKKVRKNEKKLTRNQAKVKKYEAKVKDFNTRIAAGEEIKPSLWKKFKRWYKYSGESVEDFKTNYKNSAAEAAAKVAKAT